MRQKDLNTAALSVGVQSGAITVAILHLFLLLITTLPKFLKTVCVSLPEPCFLTLGLYTCDWCSIAISSKPVTVMCLERLIP